MVRTDATCRLLSRSFVWMASYTQPTEPSTHVDRTDAIGRRVGRRATDS